MQNILVNAMGDTCPIPVVKTKNAIKEMTEGGQVEIHVDNEIAVQNLTKMANVKGYPVRSEKRQRESTMCSWKSQRTVKIQPCRQKKCPKKISVCRML